MVSLQLVEPYKIGQEIATPLTGLAMTDESEVCR
jgi:hypothetical protein